MAYVDVFTGSNIYPTEINYSAVALSADVVLSWPEETSASGDLATRIIDVVPSAAGYSIFLPDADKSTQGNTILFNNKGAFTFVVTDAVGTQVASVAAGTLWQVYLTDNTTAAGEWEILQYGATTSTANASALAGTGLVAIGTRLSPATPVTTFSTSFSVGTGDRARFYNWTGALGVLTLDDPTVVGNNWFMYLRNSGTGDVVATPPVGTTIDGLTFLDFQIGESAIIACDGTNYYTIGFGQPATFAFSYTVIDVSGGVDYVLTGSELNQISYRFTGTLTADISVVVPATTQQYWVDNETSGAFTLSVVSVAAGAHVDVAQGERAILYCDGTDILNASTAGVSLPLAIDQGGTGATTASGARINLGGTSVGVGVFTAVDETAAQAALGGQAVGRAVFVSNTALAAQTAIGGTTIGKDVFSAATTGDALTALGGSSGGQAIFTTGVVDGGMF